MQSENSNSCHLKQVMKASMKTFGYNSGAHSPDHAINIKDTRGSIVPKICQERDMNFAQQLQF